MRTLLAIVGLIAIILINAGFMKDAIKSFKKEEYFSFGLSVTCYIYNALLVAYLIFEGKII